MWYHLFFISIALRCFPELNKSVQAIGAYKRGPFLQKKSQDLVTNITFRGIMYQLITILAEYGFNPDNDENEKSQKWNNLC